jgi:lipoprotein NlpD
MSSAMLLPSVADSRRMLQLCRLLVPLLSLSCLLSACMSGGRWKAEDRWPPKSAVLARPAQYAVQPGDTLYSIAWRYGMDYHQLAAINRVGPPYTIRVGQTLNLAEANKAEPAGKSSARSTGTGVAVIGGDATSAVSPSPSYSAMKRSASPAPSRDVRAAAGLPPVPRVDVPIVWLWPADGQVIGRFSDGARVNKGIDIGGKLGDSVRSTRSGVVVYAGNGLAGYGNLVIIKHDDVYLSAYAHNKTILVREGQTIKAGDKIAEIGSSGSAYPKLHFEIRRDGKPVDPLQLLPGR